MNRFGVISAWMQEDASTTSLVHACRELGEVETLDPATLEAEVRHGGIEIRAAGLPLERFDALLLVRGIGRSGDPDLHFELYRAMERAGLLLLNRLDPLLAAQDKFRTSLLLQEAGVPTPDVMVVQREASIDDALRALSPCVCKPLWGSLGDGVERLDDDRAGRLRARELLELRASLYLQRFVEHEGRDVRAFVVGGAVQAAIERIAPAGEFRTNVSIGAEARPIALPPEAEALAVKAAQTLGLDWAGVDLAFGPSGPTVIEVNGSPNWEGIHRVTGRDMARAIAAHAARRIAERQRLRVLPAKGIGGR